MSRAELSADMIVERDIHVVEPAVAHEIGPADELLLGGPAEHLERALEAEALHRLARRDRGRDEDRSVDVVALAMAGRTFDDEALLGHAGRLRVVRAAVVFGVDRDHRIARTVARAEAGRKTGDAALDLEARLLQEAGHQPGGLELLHAELAEIEDVVAKERNRARVAVDNVEQERLLGRQVSTHGHAPRCVFRNANTLLQPSSACSGRCEIRMVLKKAWPQPS